MSGDHHSSQYARPASPDAGHQSDAETNVLCPESCPCSQETRSSQEQPGQALGDTFLLARESVLTLQSGSWWLKIKGHKSTWITP